MKNILFILIACLMVTMVKAAPNHADSTLSRRDLMIKLYTQQRTAAAMSEEFLEAVKKGDTQTIAALESRAQNGAYLLSTDKFGNNAFHLAQDSFTVQAVARSIRRLYKDEFPARINALKNQTNNSGVIPAVQSVLDRKPGKFFVLLEQSKLEQDIRRVKSLNRGGALGVAFSAVQGEVVKSLQLADGYTVVDFARDPQTQAGMDEKTAGEMQKVIAYFAENTPYL